MLKIGSGLILKVIAKNAHRTFATFLKCEFLQKIKIPEKNFQKTPVPQRPTAKNARMRVCGFAGFRGQIRILL